MHEIFSAQFESVNFYKSSLKDLKKCFTFALRDYRERSGDALIFSLYNKKKESIAKKETYKYAAVSSKTKGGQI